MLTLCTLPLRSKRDILLARQKARQVALLFHYEIQNQICIAAGTFAVACQALRQSRHSQLCIRIENKALHIVTCRGQKSAHQGPQAPEGSGLRLIKPLPPTAADVTAEEIPWLLEQLDKQAGFQLFDEIEHQNQEVLVLLHTLHHAQGQLRPRTTDQSSPSAA